MMHLEFFSKKNLSRFIVLLGTVLSIFACDHRIQTQRKRAEFLPNHAAFILKCHNLEKAKANLSKLSIVKNNKEDRTIQYFYENEITKEFKQQNSGFNICFSPTTSGTYETTYLTKDSVFKKYTNGIALENFKGLPIHEFQINNTPYWISTLQNIFAISTNKTFLKASIEQFVKEINFKEQKLINSWNTASIASFYINFENLVKPISLIDGFTKKLANKGQLAGDIDINDFDIIANVVYDFGSQASLPFTTKRASKLFKNFPNIASCFNLQVNGTSDTIAVDTKYGFFNEALSFGVLENDKQNILALELPNNYETNTLFENGAATDSLSVKKLLEEIITDNFNFPFSVNKNKFEFGMLKNNFLLLGSTMALEKVRNTTTNPERLLTYESLIENINQNAAYISFKNTETFIKGLGFSDMLNVIDYPLTGISLHQNREYGYLQIAIPKKVSQRKEVKSVRKVFETSIFNPITNGPYFFKNHLTKENNIVLQTENYKLQLFNNEGKLLWSKALNEPILGKIYEIDIFNNGRKQMTFVTPSKWYILDRNAKDLSKFPKNFSNEITQPLAFFDYDSNKKYRFGITQGKTFTVYNKKASKVGFTFKNLKEGEITQTPKHIRIANKDYVVINEDKGGVHFLSRTGKPRIKPNKTIQSKNEWFLYKNTFSTLGSDHLLTQVNTNGKIGKLKKHPSDAFTRIDASSKTWVSFTGNELFIKNNKVSLEFGSYTSPKIFYLKNKIYITITNLENDTTYLFDSNAKPIKDFPIKGSAVIDMQLDKSKKHIDIITYDTNNSLILYKLKV